MRYYKLYIKIFFAQLILTSCAIKEIEVSDYELLLQSNEIQRAAHMNNNAELLVSQIADSMISISDGKIQHMSNLAIKEKFEKYFSLVKYTSWDDVIHPLIEISDDGKSASVNFQKFLDVQYLDQNKKLGEHQYSLFAWNSHYKLIEDSWKITQITSTQKTLTEEEALAILVHLSEEYITIPEVDLLSEGIAYDTVSKTTFLSSTYK